MNPAVRALLYLVIVACADGLTLAPAMFNARYRTPKALAAALTIAAVLTVIAVVLL